MAEHAKIFTTHRAVAREVSRGVRVGARFAFIDIEKVDPVKHVLDPSLHPSLPGGFRKRLTIPLSASGKTELPGFSLQAKPDPILALRSLTIDRNLYRPLSDTVQALVVDLDRANTTTTVRLESGGVLIDEPTVELDSYGVGLTEFTGLPIGHYQLRHSEDYGGDECEFHVAGFELAPLTATLGRFRVEGNVLSVQLELSHFGRPVKGTVRVDLLDQQRRIDSRLVRARSGIALASLEFDGDGPHRLEIHLKQHADAIATVPLPGSRKAERQKTVLSRCGMQITASMLPGIGSTAIRGLHVDVSECQTSPVRVTNVHLGRARLEVMAAVEDCCVITRPFRKPEDLRRDPATDETLTTIARLGDLQPEQVVELECAPVSGLLSIGGFVDGLAWENCCVTLTPSSLRASIRISHGSDSEGTASITKSQPTVPAGASVTVHVDTRSDRDGVAAVIVRDARLQPSGRPEQKLAKCIKTTAEAAEPGVVEVADAYRASNNGGYFGPVTPRVPAIDEDTLLRLVSSGVLSEGQADEVVAIAAQSGRALYELIVELGYAEPADVCRVIAECFGAEYLDLDQVVIDDAILELCPESVARENTVIPVQASSSGEWTFAIANPLDLDTIDKLRFILNRRIRFVVSTPDSIVDAINFFYGQVEWESADSMLQEFTDTAIDFTETEDGTIAVAEDGTVAGQPPPERPEPARENEEWDVLYRGIVPIRKGVATFKVELPDEPNRYTIEAIAITERDWSQAQITFDADIDPYVKLQLPTSIFGDDQAVGRVVARARSGRLSLRVTCDEQPVELFDASGQEPIDASRIDTKTAEFTFVAVQGTYQAVVCDLESAKQSSCSWPVGPLGQLVQMRRTMRLLSPGDSVAVDSDVRRIRLLPSPEPIRQMVAEATSGFEHLCCEQTAAKLFASFACFANASAAGLSTTSSISAIRAGLRQQKELWVRGSGFAFYRDGPPNDQWGRMATQHLLKIGLLEDSLAVSTAAPLLYQITRLGMEAAEFYGIAWPPNAVGDLHDAYAILRHAERSGRLRQRENKAVEMATQMAAHQLRASANGSHTHWRSGTALAVACVLRAGDERYTAESLDVANRVLEDLGPQGRLYSTFDSVSLIVMLAELARRKLLHSESRLLVNRSEMSMREALAANVEMASVESRDDVVPVELLRWTRDDWTRFDGRVKISVSLVLGEKKRNRFDEADAIVMSVVISDGYQAGDLIWLSLPPCLSRIEGGGTLKQFAIDPEGASAVQIRLAATSASYPRGQSPRPQHFCVCLRNMFDEERVGNPGPIPVQVNSLPS